MTTLLQDLRLALRLVVKSPLFTSVVVLTMAIAIGLNTTVFAAVEALLLRPLPGATQPERIVQLYRTFPGIDWGSNSIPHYQDVRERTTDVFSGVASWTFSTFSLAAGDRPQRLMGQVVSANFFSTLGVRPALGRFFLPDEDVGRGAHPVVVLGDGGWRRLYGADPGVIGTTINLNGRTMEIVGVAPAGFRGVLHLVDPIAYVPLMQLGEVQPERARSFENRGNNFMNVVARLKDGVTPAQAADRLTAVNNELASAYPDDYAKSGTIVIPQSDAGIHPSIRNAQVGLSAVILGVVGILLLVACVNVSNLFLARARDRSREMAVRLAIGATRRQLLRQLMVESLLFSVLAGAVGIAVAVFGIGLANKISIPMEIGLRPDLQLNPTVLTFTALVTLAAGLLFGLAPALQATRPSLVPALKGEAPAGDSRSRVKQGLIVAQMALSIILLTGAGLFVSNLRTATQLDVGFNMDDAVMASVAPSLQGYDRPRTEAFYNTLLERLRQTGGVTAVGMIDQLPLALSNSDSRVEILGYVPAEGEGMNVHYSSITPDFLAAMGIRLVAGRDFTARDDSSAARVMIINERFAERFWPGEDAVGRTVKRGGRDHTVIGVVPTGKYVSLGEEPRAFMYFAQQQAWSAAMQIVVRSPNDPAALLATLRTEIQALDPQMPVVDLRPLAAHLGTALMPARIAGGALGLFGIIGLLLAAIGMYGVMAHTVGQQTREIGIRMALGSTTGAVVRRVMGQGLRQVLLGCAIGVAGAAGAFVLIRGVLYGTGSMTIATFLAAPAVLVAVAALALFIPARRASRIDAQVALRYD
ncbi:MAG: ABC transporter permease [Gemmatimonadaceae bacterium]|nr:ABC transporter permease [Gemmatimonadaceae bacterium]